MRVTVCREHEAEDPAQSTLTFAKATPFTAPVTEDTVESLTPQASGGHHLVPVVRTLSKQRDVSSGKNRHSYFRARKLQRVCVPL